MTSPCIDICQLDAAGELCVGCGRSPGEIGQWIALQPSERDEIVRRLPARLERIKSSPRLEQVVGCRR